MYVLKNGEKFEERCGGKAKVDCLEIHWREGLSITIFHKIGDKNERRTMVIIRGGGAMPLYKLNLEGGEAWLVNKQRVCRECERGEVEDVSHWLLSCPALAVERKDLLAGISVVRTEFQEMEDEEQVAVVLDNPKYYPARLL
jgi:hypothetical protein